MFLTGLDKTGEKTLPGTVVEASSIVLPNGPKSESDYSLLCLWGKVSSGHKAQPTWKPYFFTENSILQASLHQIATKFSKLKAFQLRFKLAKTASKTTILPPQLSLSFPLNQPHAKPSRISPELFVLLGVDKVYSSSRQTRWHRDSQLLKKANIRWGKKIAEASNVSRHLP